MSPGSTVEAKLHTLKAHAETAEANVELRAIAELLPKNQMMQQMLQELRKDSRDRWDQAKADLEAGIADLEKSAQENRGQRKIQDFLSALAEVAVTADAEDYGVIRPALIEFRRKYCDRTRKRVAGRRFVTAQGTPSETQSVRGQTQ